MPYQNKKRAMRSIIFLATVLKSKIAIPVHRFELKKYRYGAALSTISLIDDPAE
jgi:hypothetical protein